jgi:hypothetical protein
MRRVWRCARLLVHAILRCPSSLLGPTDAYPLCFVFVSQGTVLAIGTKNGDVQLWDASKAQHVSAACSIRAVSTLAVKSCWLRVLARALPVHAQPFADDLS